MTFQKAAAASPRGDEEGGRDPKAGRAIEIQGDTPTSQKIQDAAALEAGVPKFARERE